jgi:hypothetical protein
VAWKATQNLINADLTDGEMLPGWMECPDGIPALGRDGRTDAAEYWGAAVFCLPGIRE